MKQLKEFLHRRPSAWFMLYIPVYVLTFFAVERLVPTTGYWVSYIPWDDLIPFCEYFVVFYCMWYPLLIGTALYLCCAEDGTPLAVFCFTVGEEPAYRKIYDGAWLNEEPYAVIHRLGVSSHRGGVCSFCIQWCYAQHPNLRVDTHRVNRPMQGCLKKNGFTCCGIVYLADGSERLAYQLP